MIKLKYSEMIEHLKGCKNEVLKYKCPKCKDNNTYTLEQIKHHLIQDCDQMEVSC